MKGDARNMRRFGIEIEHVNSLSHSQIASALETSGVPVDHSATGRYASRGYRGWQVKHDGSIRTTVSHPHAIELVSPPLPFKRGASVPLPSATSSFATPVAL